MFKKLKEFRRDEHGAVTVDWVVITAALVGLSVLVIIQIKAPVESLDAKSGSALANIDIKPITFD